MPPSPPPLLPISGLLLLAKYMTKGTHAKNVAIASTSARMTQTIFGTPQIVSMSSAARGSDDPGGRRLEKCLVAPIFMPCFCECAAVRWRNAWKSSTTCLFLPAGIDSGAILTALEWITCPETAPSNFLEEECTPGAIFACTASRLGTVISKMKITLASRGKVRYRVFIDCALSAISEAASPRMDQQTSHN